MYILNIALRNFVRTNPIASSFVMMMAVNMRDPNEYTTDQYEQIIKESKETAGVAYVPCREYFPESDLGETIYRDLRSQYFINKRVYEMEHPALDGETFGEMLNCWNDRLHADPVIAEHSKCFSAASLDFEARNIEIAAHRVK